MKPVSRRAALVLAVTLAVVGPALPALADEGTAPEEPASPGSLDIVAALSAEFAAFGMDPAQVRLLYEAGVGLGDIFKLHVMAAVGGVGLADLVAQLTGDDGELALGFGEWKHGLTPEQLAVLGTLARNLGQVVAAAHRPDHAGPGDHSGDHGHGRGHGSPGGGD